MYNTSHMPEVGLGVGLRGSGGAHLFFKCTVCLIQIYLKARQQQLICDLLFMSDKSKNRLLEPHIVKYDRPMNVWVIP